VRIARTPLPAGGAVHARIDGQAVTVPAGTTIRAAAAQRGADIPTLCFLEGLTPVNVCRLCVVDVEGSRTLVPSCSRALEEGMVVETRSARVENARRLVLELLVSAVDMDRAGPEVMRWLTEYGVDPGRFGPPVEAPWAASPAGRHAPTDGSHRQTLAQPPRIDNALYVRDPARCILCYKCVQACGEEAQNTFAIAKAGRGLDSRIATEFDGALADSACVYCGNCVAVCPTGALMVKSEFDLRAKGAWDASRQTVTSTICPYCGVGCTLDLHVQDNEIVKVTSPQDHDVTRGYLCVKGRFGFAFVQAREFAGDGSGGQGGGVRPTDADRGPGN
jgi:predicted molibdopterin-dependent oxidoreductase YjgC